MTAALMPAGTPVVVAGCRLLLEVGLAVVAVPVVADFDVLVSLAVWTMLLAAAPVVAVLDEDAGVLRAVALTFVKLFAAPVELVFPVVLAVTEVSAPAVVLAVVSAAGAGPAPVDPVVVDTVVEACAEVVIESVRLTELAVVDPADCVEGGAASDPLTDPVLSEDDGAPATVESVAPTELVAVVEGEPGVAAVALAELTALVAVVDKPVACLVAVEGDVLDDVSEEAAIGVEAPLVSVPAHAVPEQPKSATRTPTLLKKAQ